MRWSLGLRVAATVVGAVLLVAPAAARQNDLDDFMRQVLAKRDENWKKLQQYILEENTAIDVHGPSRVPIWGERREYSWFVRDGFFIRSPISVNGVTIGEDERRKAEDDYFKRAKNRDAGRGSGPGTTVTPIDQPPSPTDMSGLLSERRAPEFVESAYFLRFRFEEGKYALVGRESFEGQSVLHIEYYPARLFSRDADRQARAKRAGTDTRDKDLDAAIERMMNKVSLVSLWVEPKSHQIIKYTFDNVNFDFLPGAWLVRITDAKASMTMSQPFKDVWLPKDVDMLFGAMVAIGNVDIRYHLDFHDYKEATTAGRIKKIGGVPVAR
jgi:hypothetical protein